MRRSRELQRSSSADRGRQQQQQQQRRRMEERARRRLLLANGGGGAGSSGEDSLSESDIPSRFRVQKVEQQQQQQQPSSSNGFLPTDGWRPVATANMFGVLNSSVHDDEVTPAKMQWTAAAAASSNAPPPPPPPVSTSTPQCAVSNGAPPLSCEPVAALPSVLLRVTAAGNDSDDPNRQRGDSSSRPSSR